ncbi:MAG: tRNA 2-thiouridine(34) synthase MnmA [Candidatus Nealsonbacteria bacterium]|nr:tRNA 2-thiouridine(34) synthase MnmA [Candidatus Nealsonbacteria bacterium]
MKKKLKIAVAMSGGVDSSVTAALLKKQGFEASGIFMKLFNSPALEVSEKRARKIAKTLGISFLVFDLRKEFKKRIINYFLSEYEKGRTPNPCVVCNKEIKFGLLLERAVSLKSDFIASGHYVRKAGEKLLIAKDKNKDQSYFLWKLNQKLLSRILFPLGNYNKQKVKDLAKELKLPLLNIPESQEICFVGKDINIFLKKYLKPKQGVIVNEKKEIIGWHKGFCFYTIGQRKGIGLSGGPYYVTGKDLKKNILIVSKNKKDLAKKELIAENVNWISGKKPKFPLRIKAKTRYRQKSFPATVQPFGKKIKVIFDKPQRAITPGQSVVFYSGQELLGGGIIC